MRCHIRSPSWVPVTNWQPHFIYIEKQVWRTDVSYVNLGVDLHNESNTHNQLYSLRITINCIIVHILLLHSNKVCGSARKYNILILVGSHVKYPCLTFISFLLIFFITKLDMTEKTTRQKITKDVFTIISKTILWLSRQVKLGLKSLKKENSDDWRRLPPPLNKVLSWNIIHSWVEVFVSLGLTWSACFARTELYVINKLV